MIRPLEASNTLQILAQKNQEPEQLKGTIRQINYSTWHIQVLVSGYGLLKRVKVAKRINIGTADRPGVFKGDKATVVRSQTGWKCIAIEAKDHCATRTSEFGDDVVLENEVEPDTADSYTVQQLGSLALPDDLYIPPFEPGGQLTLPDIRFPSTDDFICTLPPCTNCFPDGLSAGYVLKISSDDAHPSGCYVWGPRQGVVCPVQFTTQILLQAPGVDEDVFPGDGIAIWGDYAYVIAHCIMDNQFIPEPVGNSNLFVIDISNINAPTVVNTIDVGYPLKLCNAMAHNDELWITGIEEDLFGFTSRLLKYDLSSPASPSNTGDTITDISFQWTKYIDSSDNAYMVGPNFVPSGTFLGDDFVVIDGSSITTIGTVTVGPQLVIAPVVAGDVALQGLLPTPDIVAIDLTTPSSPAILWNDTTGANFPIVVVNDTYVYASNYRYDLTNPAVLTKDAFTDGSIIDQVGKGAFVLNDCLYFIPISPSTGTIFSYNIIAPLAPVFGDAQGSLIDQVEAIAFGTDNATGTWADSVYNAGIFKAGSVGANAGADVEGLYVSFFTLP